MSRTEAIIKMDAYLKLHNIPHQKDIDMGCQRYTMMYRSPASPGGFAENDPLWDERFRAFHTSPNRSGEAEALCSLSPHQKKSTQSKNIKHKTSNIMALLL